VGQLLLRNFDDHLKSRLKERARRHGVSMEEEARRIMRAALDPDEKEYGLGSEIAALFRHIEGNEEPLPELSTKPWRPMTFNE